MVLLISILLIFIFFAISVFHFYWAFGGKWGFENSLPQKENGERVMNPKVFECILVAIIFIAFGLILLIKGRLISLGLPVWLNQYGLYFLAFIFIARAIGEFRYVGFFKKIKKTSFGILDTKVYSPLCLIIGILLIVLQKVAC